MSFGLTIEKLFLIGIVALLVIGPDRLPGFATQLANIVKRLRDMARGAETRLRDELGDEFSVDELKKLDPRQYDPRRIIRDALTEDQNPSPTAKPQKRPAVSRDPQATTPFDGEAT